jgi:hypothetical protein
MELVERMRRWLRGAQPTLIDYEAYEQQNPEQAQATGTDGPYSSVLGKVGLARQSAETAGPEYAGGSAPAANYKIQQSYDSLLATVHELRSALDGQARRQEELFDRLSTLPHAVEALPQTSKMQADMLKMINDRLAMHAQQQKKVSDVVTALGPGKKEHAEALGSIREQIEMGNEIDRQLVESFNRFSMMIDRLQLANQHAVDALQQVRDSYASSAMQMHEWIEKSRHRNTWLIGGAFLMAGASLIIVLLLVWSLFGFSATTPTPPSPPTPAVTK